MTTNMKARDRYLASNADWESGFLPADKEALDESSSPRGHFADGSRRRRGWEQCAETSCGDVEIRWRRVTGDERRGAEIFVRRDEVRFC